MMIDDLSYVYVAYLSIHRYSCVIVSLIRCAACDWLRGSSLLSSLNPFVDKRHRKATRLATHYPSIGARENCADEFGRGACSFVRVLVVCLHFMKAKRRAAGVCFNVPLAVTS